MCGVVGVFTKGVSGVETLKNVEWALQKISHRGPDGQGVERFNMAGGSLVLGHRRLSIIDLSEAGLQPMVSENGRYVITFNGEIYNYIELREMLIAKGYNFRTKTDTEVLLVAWEEWGKGCLARLDGMFAFSIFDKYEKVLICVRDPFGIKPFFYQQTSSGLYFASELPALLELLPGNLNMNGQRAYSYLCWGDYDDSNDTFYKDVYQLKPGEILTANLERQLNVNVERWWWPKIEQQKVISFDDASEKLRNLFLESVKRQLRSDVPLGAALSGGVDSSAIVCAMKYLEPDLPIHTFSYIAKGSSLSEERWSKRIVDHVNAIPHWIDDPLGEFSVDMDDIVRAHGEPFGSTSIAAGYRVYQAANEAGITVTLDGQGADELLAGYDGYPTSLFKNYIEGHRYWELLQFINKWRRWPGRDWRKTLLHFGDAIVPSRFRALALQAFGYRLEPKWLKAECLQKAGIIPEPPKQLKEVADGKGRRLSERLRTAMTQNRLPALLRHGDRNSMAWSIESRVPFLSTKIAEFTLGLPENYLVSSEGETKHLFRHAMRGIVPDDVLFRKDKVGFETPERELLNLQRNRVNSWIEAAAEISFVNPDEFKTTVDKVLDGEVRFSFKAWRMINFCRWVSLQPKNVLAI